MVLEASDFDSARSKAVFLPLDFLGLIRLEGPDVADYLQRISSQDAEGLAQGTSAPTCLLTGKGKLLAHFCLMRLSDHIFYAETLRERLADLRELLDRYIFTEKIELCIMEDHQAIGLLGPEAPALAAPTVSALSKNELRKDGFLLRARSDELGLPFCRIHGLPPALEEERARLTNLDVPTVDRELFDALRIDAGQPLFGVDADETTIPLEVGLDDACHPTKGCYTGQEIVARIRTYGHVNRKLMRVHFRSDTPFEPGSLIYDEGMEAGRLTSSYLSPEDGTWHALALLPLAVQEDEDTDLHVGSESGPALTLHLTE